MKEKWSQYKSIIILGIIITLFISGTVFYEKGTSPVSHSPKGENIVDEGDTIEEDSIEEVTPLYLYMEEDNLEDLYTRDPLDSQRLDGYIKLSQQEGEERRVEVRFRGDSTRYLPKKSFHIRFEEGQDFIFGSNRLNLNASYTDPSLMREKLAMDMFKELGLPAPRAKYIDLYINDIYEGLYIHIERIDENLLKNAGLNPNGTLVRDEFIRNIDKEEIDRSSLFGYNIDSIEEKEDFLKENFDYRNKPDWGALAQLASWIYDTPAGEEFYRGFQEKFYLEEFIDWLAIHFLIGDVDSFGDDYWLYIDHQAPNGRWRLIPWDKDLTFGSTFRPGEYVDNNFFAYEYHMIQHGHRNNDIITKFMTTDELRQKLYDRMEYLMEETFSPNYFKRKTSNLRKAIEDSVGIQPSEEAFRLHSQNHHGDLGDDDYYIENILDFIELRYGYLKTHIKQDKRDRYRAEIQLANYKAGDTLYFTDGRGWTMGKLEVHAIKGGDSILMEVEEIEDILPINRLWKITTNAEKISGQLTLYYRNDIYYFGRENWYHEDSPLGNQWSLVIGRYNKGEIETLESTVNPYSNKVTTTIELKNQEELIMTYQQ
ncbi:CotH kinase family protein [Natronincola ferrireducens]|uniref:Spore coat protein H n=1 Tax=Natronincola ferrireducens TaxID=393762 RepID=A0A1G8WXB3_9FIRM|nr:CotH kinase family protein [Natronincola ferrireducens]SDJ82841.1 spore coat protein H [Natronincola ferrireducens]